MTERIYNVLFLCTGNSARSSPRGGADMMKALYDRGLWAIFSAFNSSILQFKPGLFIDRPYCDTALQLIRGKIRARLPMSRTGGSGAP
jgi:acetylornithine/succinyldiaminopimelate/putrescine aminotransferase